MSMTREEAIEILRKRQRCCKVIAEHTNEAVKADELREVEAIDLALAALRGPTREMVERMFPGCDFCTKELDDYPYIVAHSDYSSSDTCYEPGYCPICSRPLTDEAVGMMLERLEALKDG